MSTMSKCTVLLALLVIGSAAWTDVSAGQRRGDRFGLRLGAWPQSAVKGNLGTFNLTRDDGVDTIVARFDEPSAIAPFIELYGLFHLRGVWSIEAAVGWSTRRDIQVAGYVNNLPDSVILLGEGRVDFIPLFVGLRAEKHFGAADSRHNLYLRSGLSLIFANESPSATYPSLERSYSPGSEGAPGFVFGGGVEYYFAKRYAVTYDMQFRHAWFSYARNAKFNQYGLWVSVGIVVSTR